MNAKQKQAQDYLTKYGGRTLLEKWTGHKLFLHVWHKPKMYHLLTYDKYLDRVIEIAEQKPENERIERFQLMKPSTYAARDKADAAWVKADAAKLEKAHETDCPNCKWDGDVAKGFLPQFN